jgi:RNA polymerase sigma-70 factor (ECF subfamily)
VPAIDEANSTVGLAMRLRARDPRAAREAFARLSPFVLRQLRRASASAADREDLAQEVFLRFFARIDELRSPCALRPFLLGICLGVTRNERRRAEVRRRVELRPPDELGDAASTLPDPESRELAGRLHALLARACPSDRALFLMRYGEEMELKEMAAARGASLSTVRRQLAIASRRIRARMRSTAGLRPER